MNTNLSEMNEDKLVELNRTNKLYYMKFCYKGQEPEIRIYRTMHGINFAMSNILGCGGVVMGIANVTKQARPMTDISFELSGI